MTAAGLTISPFTHDAYRALLRAGKVAGHRFAGFNDVPAARVSGGKFCFLRHDCDNDLVAAVRMAEIEAEEGLRSTYFVMLRSAMYNLLAPPNRALVMRLVEMGHWLGLHFDDSVTACVSENDVPARVDCERQTLREEFGQEIAVVSFHQPGRRILDSRLKLNCLNTYDREDMDGLHYTSDSNLAFRGGDPVALFENGAYGKIQILIHPEWWTAEPMSLARKWDRMLTNNFELMQQSLLDREDTFTARRTIRMETDELGE